MTIHGKMNEVKFSYPRVRLLRRQEELLRHFLCLEVDVGREGEDDLVAGASVVVLYYLKTIFLDSIMPPDYSAK